ncbi:protocadherin gamma-B5-like [Mizuhopecten yessoensis]|uniref:Protocadherin-11 X-linked n=1 Tax=Mizuhopecten yessoensis TaxID=6573 RepID=A0A210PLD9_MIZYE|nr:protocadherin gamma-B5-like [Mizuhopecten yessoensis]XP_021339139.1 protocadherin gamma-B5-like [Mizuhopecten yessoensis]XP_021339140.1 protocadherin gamma-B5-like [Mizuhopecten yessoensis]XP_021339141.1 protocadherin gamma-B5-like [Mizuhopecten yessoensis]XP_021339142.1 protocadherin gamma-B5-like [Mizuhopecten yessoensis]XP_021339143.1 protocadherin gamma-B5-like [Mizuhopecten yessoensis]OWF37246.1 Protocadherin-11 X-linked [Mizuhopecten yessoensis]
MANIHIILLFSLILLNRCLANPPNITFPLQEEMPNNTIIGSIIEELDLATKLEPSVLASIQFRFMDVVPTMFRIDSDTSKIFTAGVINREDKDVCKFKVDCFFDFEVLVGTPSSTVYLEIITIRINITDKNDNTPTFSKLQMVLNISESTAIHKSFLIESAQDLDRGVNNSIQSYQLVALQPQSDFVLRQEANDIDDNPILNLEVNQELDYERQTNYELIILARDGGVPQRTGTLTIQVNILDENDNKPIFKDPSVNITVTEDLQPNSLIFTMDATDKDSGKLGEVFYRLRKSQPQEIYELFDIGEDDGTLTVKGTLLYQPGKVYIIIVEASDKGSNPLVSTAIVRLAVRDTGNNAPIISISFISDKYTDKVEICECAELQMFVALIQVSDIDTGANGEVTCSTFSTYFGLSSFGSQRYKVIVQHKLDRESIPEHNITVTCHDKGTPQLDGSVTFTVIVSDDNDNPPKFSQHYYSINMEENNSPGHEVIQVSATDDDIGENGVVTYAIDPATDLRFEIDAISGVVRANMVFDREATAHVTLSVIAIDNGSPQLNATATVVIDIIDQNDRDPEFLKSIFPFRISENLPAETPVGSVTAVDEDQNSNGEVRYRFPPNFDAHSVPFVIYPSGEIKTTKELNREDLSRYDFAVQAYDQGNPPRTGTTQVVITVTDSNDNTPQFIFPNEENYTISVPHTTPEDSIIASIQAYDMDEGENGKVMFFIKKGDVDNMFYLNHETGSLHIRRAFEFHEDRQYTLTLEVKDRGSPIVQSKDRDLHIVVRYVNTTTMITTPQNTDKFVLIVVSVVCVTVVLSIGLIAVICVLRKREKDKNNNPELSFPTQCTSIPNLYDEPNPNRKDYPSSQGKSKAKAKVSFSLDSKSPFTKNQLLQKLTGSPTGKKPEVKDTEKLVVHLPGGQKSTPSNPEKLNNLHQKQVIVSKSHQEESLSESSGETLPSDSGHGGSEEDFSHADNQNTFELNPLFAQGKDTSGIYVIRQHSQGVNSDVPITKPLKQQNRYSLPTGGIRMPCAPLKNNNHYLDDSLLTSSVNSTMCSTNRSQNSHKNNSNNVNTLPTIFDLQSKGHSSFDFGSGSMFYGKDFTLGSHSAHSRDDDEVTTTSGSYTINPDELDDDFSIRPNDLYV